MNDSKRLLGKSLIASLALLLVGEVATACPNQQNITLKVGVHSLDFNENQPICVRAGETFRFKLNAIGNYDLDPDDISIHPKTSGPTFTVEGVTANNFMEVKVSNVTPSLTPIGFEIRVEGVGTLDPRVRIIENYAPLGQDFIDLENQLIEEFGLSFTDLLSVEDAVATNKDGLKLEELLRILKAESGYY